MLIACPACGTPTSRALCIACANPHIKPRPTEHKIGGLTVINRTGEPFDEQEIIDALMNATTDHLKPYPQGPREGTRD